MLKTVLYVEDLIAALKHSKSYALGYNGGCNDLVGYDRLMDALEKLKEKSPISAESKAYAERVQE